ncbi:MAG: S41 family peptidase [Elusimicrobiaceae bacterium]
MKKSSNVRSKGLIRYWFLLIALGMFPVASQAAEADVFISSGQSRINLFDSYIQTVRDNTVFSQEGFQKLGTTWERESERAKKLFLAAQNKEDVYYSLLALKNSIHNTHSTLNIPEALNPEEKILLLPLKLAPQGSSNETAQIIVVKSDVPQIKKGFILREYDGKQFPELEYEYLQWHGDNSPEFLKMRTVQWLTSRNSKESPLPSQKSVKMLFYDPQTQTTVQVSPQWQQEHKSLKELLAPPAASPCGLARENDKDYADFKFDFAGVNYCIYKDSATKTLLLRYLSFYYRLPPAYVWNRTAFLSYNPKPVNTASPYPFMDQLAEIDSAELRAYLNRQDWNRLLIDVRENDGGTEPIEFLRFLADKPFKQNMRSLVFTPLMRRNHSAFDAALAEIEVHGLSDLLAENFQNREAKESFLFPYSLSCPGKCALDSLTNAEVQPDKGAHKFVVAVLSGPFCVSACDQFVSTFKDNDMGRFFGLPSRGGTMPSSIRKEFALDNGEKFHIRLAIGKGYRPNGEILEGNPPAPDFFLYPQDNYIQTMLKRF